MSLPYVPQAYPDEIVGSWLRRIALHNGPGAWQPFLAECGFWGQQTGPMFHMVNHDPKTDVFFAELGTTYEDALITLTTLPYWAFFDSASTEAGTIAGTQNIPKLISRDGTLLCDLVRFRPTGQMIVRFCPLCLEDDFASKGETYWHRVHQLPGVFFCPHHRCPLLSACPKCGLRVAPSSYRLLPLPALRCSCGHDLCQRVFHSNHSDRYIAMADFALATLQSHNPAGDRHMVRGYLNHLLIDSRGSRYNAYIETLESSFTVVRRAAKKLYLSVPGSRVNEYFELEAFFCRMTAPECSALLSAMNIDFNAAIEGIRNAERAPDSGRISLENLTIPTAREEMNRRVALGGETASTYFGKSTKLYWFLRLRDTVWLKKRFPRSMRFQVPSIKKDRTTLSRIFAKDSVDSQEVRREARTSSAGIRARIRDKRWYESQIQKIERISPSSISQSASTGTSALRIHRLEEALRRILEDEPKRGIRRIDAVYLATVAGLSAYQSRAALRSCLPLRQELDRINADRFRRRARVAVKQLIAEGAPVRICRLLERTGQGPDAYVAGRAVLKEMEALHRE